MLSRSSFRRRAALAAATVATVAAGLALTAPAQAAATYPVTPNIAAGVAQSLADPSASPPGVNVDCTPSAAHPDPVVLINGTFANMVDDWSGLGPRLANDGYCVYSTALGANPHLVLQTTGKVADSARQLAAFVDQVRSRTGASKVDLVGHSQGGLLGEYYLKLLGGASKVRSYVGLSPTTHGTTLNGLAYLAAAFPGAGAIVSAACPACGDQIVGSPVIRAVDDGPIAQSGVSYTVIETHAEFVVTPAGSAFIDEPGVRNEWIQDSCATDFDGHANLPYSTTVYGLTRNALDPAHARPVHC